jgi:beta-lactamase superfamily II metal-dependent hydrolase
VRVIVFDVQHGFCAFVKTPTGRTLLIDCGKSEDFSPADYVYDHELITPMLGVHSRLTKLVVTHPHNDHIEDISNVEAKLNPEILLRQDYNWAGVKAIGGEGDYTNLDAYSAFQAKYNTPVTQPDWGCLVQSFLLSVGGAQTLNPSKCINNSGIVTVVTFTGTRFSQKFLFGADIETDGVGSWSRMLH